MAQQNTTSTSTSAAADRYRTAQHVVREVGGRAAQAELRAAEQNLQQVAGRRGRS